MPAHYFLGSAYLGQSSNEISAHAHSLAYFCQTCGTVWGRIVVDGASVWSVELAPCEAHRPVTGAEIGRVPGSLLTTLEVTAGSLSLMWAAKALDNLPINALRREAAIHLSHHERVENEPLV